MAALPPNPPPIEPPQAEPVTSQPMQVDAFQSAMANAGAALFANPDAVGRALIAELDGFNTRATQVQQAVGASLTDANPAATDTATPPVTSDIGHELDVMHQHQEHMLGLMMETYSFALEAEAVSRAATTFTSSVNTLIKTQ